MGGELARNDHQQDVGRGPAQQRGLTADVIVDLARWGVDRLVALHQYVRADLERGAGTANEIEELRFAEVVEYLVTNRAAAGRKAKAGAAVRRPRGVSRVEVDVFYLDENDEPMISRSRRAPHRTYAASRLDAELASAFGDRDVIVFN